MCFIVVINCVGYVTSNIPHQYVQHPLINLFEKIENLSCDY